jgi:hypothetical protein
MSDTNARDCQHGQLARSCDRCADAAEIAGLREEVERLRMDLENTRAEALLAVATERKRWTPLLLRLTESLAARLGTNADEWPDVCAARALLDAGPNAANHAP